MDTLANDGRAIKVGRNATAEAASDAMMIVWNIVGIVGSMEWIMHHSGNEDAFEKDSMKSLYLFHK